MCDGPLRLRDDTCQVEGTAAGTTLNVGSPTGFGPGQNVLIHQTRGANAGQYELATVSVTGANALVLS